CVAMGLLYGLPGHGTSLGYAWNPEQLGETLFQQLYGAAKFYVVSLVYLALFVMPLLIGAAWEWHRQPCGCWKRRLLWTLPVFAALTVLVAMTSPHRLPFLGNILYDGGLGPMTLGSRVVDGGAGAPAAWGGGWWISTLLGLLGSAWMLVALAGWVRSSNGTVKSDESTKRRQQFFLGTWALLMIFALYNPWLPVRFDRYLLGAFIPVVVLVAGVAHSVSLRLRVVQVFFLLLIFGFSLAAQHDYMAWNRVRWQALDGLLDAGVAPERIDGGYEFNGWHTSHHFIDAMGSKAFLYSGPKGWWVIDDAYAVDWQERPGYTVREALPYDTWLGRGRRLLVLERE
ncbi:MAG: hypothetical protein L3K26_15625, partial [Candidatus Hydrogenedentes bacterium]|nr:hypothetical protein [Candidatus Hydrogenedentota bacterium]